MVQLGKWQRVFTETITPCMTNTLAAHLTLPSTHLQGNIPLFAIDTGAVDSMECVLRKMGIADAEFVDPAIVGACPPPPGACTSTRAATTPAARSSTTQHAERGGADRDARR